MIKMRIPRSFTVVVAHRSTVWWCYPRAIPARAEIWVRFRTRFQSNVTRAALEHWERWLWMAAWWCQCRMRAWWLISTSNRHSILCRWEASRKFWYTIFYSCISIASIFIANLFHNHDITYSYIQMIPDYTLTLRQLQVCMSQQNFRCQWKSWSQKKFLTFSDSANGAKANSVKAEQY